MKSIFPWLIAVLAGVTMMVSNGLSITGLSVYDEAILGEFGWSRSALKFRDMITLSVTGLVAPFAGIAIDRFGVRRCMVFGWLLLLVAYLFYVQLESLFGLYFIHFLFGITLVFCGLNAGVILVSHWFVRRRGTAIGLALTGTSFGGALFPQYGTFMLSLVDWREAFAFAMIFPVLMLLLTIFVIRDRPGPDDPTDTLPEAEAAAPAAAPPPDTGDAGVEYLDALRTRTFWALSLIAMATFYTVLGMQAHLFLYMRDLQFSAVQATNMISLFFLCGLVGKFVFGALADYLPRQRVFYFNMLIMLGGMVPFAMMRPEWIAFAVVTAGFGWGGVYSLIQLSAMNCFGLVAAGKILGTITILDALGGGLGIWLTGLLYDTLGDYRLAFAIFAGLTAFALLCVTQVRPVMRRSALQPRQ